MILTIVILLLTVLMFIMGKIRADMVALCSLTILLLCGILTPEEALSGFSSTVIIMMIGLFVISGAIFQTGLAKEVSNRIMLLSKGKETLMYLLVMLTTAFIGAFVSNTGTVALMMPIIVNMVSQTENNTRKFLMPLAFASSMGGMLTLIGTPPNLIINDSLVSAGYNRLSFFSFFPVGIITVMIGIVVLFPLCKFILGKRKDNFEEKKQGMKSLDELVDEYDLQAKMRVYRVLESSSIKNKSVAELDLPHRYGLSIFEIRKEEHHKNHVIRHIQQNVAKAETKFQEGDIIYITGNEGDFEKFESEMNLERKFTSSLDFYEMGIVELVVMPGSKKIGCSIKDSDIRDKYSISIIGIKRYSDYITTRISNETMKEGDVLLVQGSWKNIERLESDGDWVVLGRPEEQQRRVILDYKAPMAAVIMFFMICAMVFDFIPIAPVTAVMVAALLMILTGCLHSVETAYKTINWESIVLIAAMMPMSIALEKTGVSQIVANSLVTVLGTIGPLTLLAGIYFTTSLLTMFISNTATAVLMAPIALTSAMELGVSPYAFLFAVTLGASMCFASPFSTPPNVLVMKAGNYVFMDYVKVGLPLQLIIGIVMTFLLPLLFPF